MDDDARLEALNQLWQNICLTYTYEPGSTAKPFTVAAGLETEHCRPMIPFSVMEPNSSADLP